MANEDTQGIFIKNLLVTDGNYSQDPVLEVALKGTLLESLV